MLGQLYFAFIMGLAVLCAGYNAVFVNRCDKYSCPSAEKYIQQNGIISPESKAYFRELELLDKARSK